MAEPPRVVSNGTGAFHVGAAAIAHTGLWLFAVLLQLGLLLELGLELAQDLMGRRRLGAPRLPRQRSSTSMRWPTQTMCMQPRQLPLLQAGPRPLTRPL